MGQLVWQKSIPDYLCFTALEAGTFTLTVPAAVTSSYLSYVEYSLDGRNWNRTDILAQDQTIQVGTAQNPIPAGGKVYWRGSGIRYMANDTRANNYFSQASYFSSTGRFDVSGNIMSMLYADDFGGKTSFPGTSSQYENIGAMFQHCTNLVHAKDLLLPAMTLKHLCYTGMFEYCSSLVDAPVLPATSVSSANYCYRYMYRYCTSLVEPSDLSHVTDTGRSSFQEMYRGCTSLIETTFPQAATYGQYCCYGMYLGCTSITSADMSYARTLNDNSCPQLFFGCTNLKYVKCLATDISATDCLTNWLYNVSSTGTFIQASGVEWPRGASGIPTGWLAYDEGEQIPNDYTPCDYIHITKGSGMVADVLADKSTYGCELEYNFTQNELDAAANNNTYIPLMYYSKAVTTDPDFPKQICGQLYLRYNANWLGWQRNAGIYIRPTTGEKITNSSAIVMKRPAVTGWHYIRCAATTTDDDFICLFDDEISQTGINYYRLMNENPTDEPAEIYISCRSASAAYPIDNGGDMKYFKIIHPDGETIVADYVPCVRKSDNVAGFWDKVGLVFKSSFRTPFVAGYNQT